MTKRILLRSKRKRTILFCYYRRAFLWFVLLSVPYFVMGIGHEGFWSECWPLLLIPTLISLGISIVAKGTLAESVTMDYSKREITISYYSLLGRESERIISAKGLHWRITSPRGRGWDRLKIYPKEGPKVVICQDLGWEEEDFEKLSVALEKITALK